MFQHFRMRLYFLCNLYREKHIYLKGIFISLWQVDDNMVYNITNVLIT